MSSELKAIREKKNKTPLLAIPSLAVELAEAEIKAKTTILKKYQITEEMNADDLVRHYAIDVIASAVFGLEINSITDKSNKFYQISQSLVNFTIPQKITLLLMKIFPTLAKIGMKKNWLQGLVFFLAGFEGPATVLTLAIHELALHPGIQQKLYEEIRQFKEEKKSLTYETVRVLKRHRVEKSGKYPRVHITNDRRLTDE
ncbi:Probable cytochrome P450 6a13 [Eumeta japonica]|uniref:unspecific monooxygenase n=1 Tax=Eumeta variegata TaxID=151549 RepID=A0A4C1YMS9_EUMVA|nr:Probable cytochrome P450 6a13 [Eumeta japonica]